MATKTTTNTSKDDDFLDFDVISPYHGYAGGVGFGRGVTLQELNEGTIIETPEKGYDGEDDEVWWTTDELVKHLDDKSGPSVIDKIPWEEKILAMEELVKDQVYKKTIKPGIGAVLNSKNTILFHCNGYIEGNKEPFDSSVLRGKPILHRLDREDLLPGLMIGVLSMRSHEKAEIIIKPDYAFGELGCPPRIEGNATIIYIVEILKIFEEGTLTDYELMTNDELTTVPFSDILKKCNEQRQSGNSYFKAEKYRDAALRYSKAIKFLEKYFYKDPVQQSAARDVLSKLYPNLANALIRLRKLRPAMTYCHKALAIDPFNVKALMQLGKAKFNNGEFADAKIFFLRALDLRPADSYIGSYLTRVEQKLQEEENDSTKLWKKIANGYCGNKE